MPIRIHRKYQIFISSTYSDLHEERKAVTWAVLSARHIPVGMENFHATDDRGWQTIKSAIDESDYYVLILGGRYGSVDSEGKSWTEQEYDYAVGLGIPVLTFVRSKKYITAEAMEENSRLRHKLDAFQQRVQKKHLCEVWTTSDSLEKVVTLSLQNHIQVDEGTERQRPGWFRGTDVPNLLQGEAGLVGFSGKITSLTDGQVVPRQLPISGLIDYLSPALQAFIIVEIQNGSLYPQNRVPRVTSKWSTEICIGRAGKGLDTGSEFTVHLVAVGAETAYEFERYIRGDSRHSDSIGRKAPADMAIMDTKVVVRGDS
jgi:hypothetical protein